LTEEAADSFGRLIHQGKQASVIHAHQAEVSLSVHLAEPALEK
jgi:hypothetical protein